MADLGGLFGGAASGAQMGTAVAPGWGTVIGGALGALGGLFGSNKAEEAAREAAQQRQMITQQALGALTPQSYGSQTGLGGVGYNAKTGQVTSNLNPQLAGMQQGLFGTAGGYFNQLNQFDPTQAATSQFNLMESILAPGREQARQSEQARLLRQGLLGTTAGGIVQQASSQAVEQQRKQNLLAAMQEAQQTQQHLLGLGQGALGTGTGITQNLLSTLSPARQGAELNAQINAKRAQAILGQYSPEQYQAGLLGGGALAAGLGSFGAGIAPSLNSYFNNNSTGGGAFGNQASWYQPSTQVSNDPYTPLPNLPSSYVFQ